MYLYAQTAMHKRQILESPSCALRVMQQPRLGAVTTSDILASVTPTTTDTVAGIGFNSPLLIGGIALLAVGLFMFYGRKTHRQYKSYQRKRAKRSARIQALESELALAKAS